MICDRHAQNARSIQNSFFTQVFRQFRQFETILSNVIGWISVSLEHT